MSRSESSDKPLPICADCRVLDWRAPFGWLRRGWADLQRAPRTSLSYGLIMVALSYAITAAAWYFGNLGLYLGVLSGFVFIGPVLVMTLYAVSARLAAGAEVSIRRSLQDAGRTLSDAAIFALILLVVFLVWARAATMIHVFFPMGGEADWRAWATFLGIGSAVGAMFCAFIFMASAFSLPMMLDRRADTVTAVITSVNATLRNKPTMAVWALCIGAFVTVGVLTGYIAFAVLLPWIGHATWHAYQETIDASAWPRRHLTSG
ncbi:DUF2189 domain-containing protein [Algiphilus aromaticivorans]|uniref:DUF2189 domain-containing protein n=1 Tax=Algiphilus aromaticivorans TaxID=382454 RepID=UPI0005C22285|nr:DUF2189 domain-containing protein [Algiphilus aromaticivorans]